MALFSWQIHEVLTGPWQRLFAGGFAYLVCLALSVAMLMPGVYIAAFARVRGRL
jgi:putative peptidoglycan lipid II flippase